MDWLPHHLEQDLDGILLTDPMDDLARLIASPISSTLSEEKAITSAGDVRFSEVESAEINILEMTSKHPKSSSWNLSFGHPESYKELALPACTASNSRIHMPQFEQAHFVESLLNSMEDGLYQNVSIAQASCTRKRKQPSQGTQHKQVYAVDGLLDGNVDEYYPSVPSTQWVHFQGSERHRNGLANSHSLVATPLAKKYLQYESASLYGGGSTTLVGPNLLKNEAHIMAERKRRDKLNQRFVALSAILPGLKKVDKATILGDAVKYVRQLEEQLKELEGKVSKGVDPVTRKNNNTVDRQDEKIRGTQQPDIEVRMIGKNVLIRVHCDNIRSILLKAVEELERLPLSIVNANVLSFSNTAMDLTFTAQIEEDTQLTADDIVKALHSFFEGLM